ncbi:MAG: DUF559 domain-containing protein [Prevotellaceae bacterium]|jgi:excinuclease ABC A subunit|nr:DUF559 domain-containing protein [Prevotellaceae bacterium]
MSATENISIKGARVHNLKNIDVEIPRNKLVVITGLSGSGKSSLAFDTLYAEGQRRYVESLSAYARQFLGRMSKPEVDYIKGIPPAIAIEQKVNTRNPRSTVGTSTEIYEYIKLLFARIGKTFSPVSGQLVQKQEAEDVVKTVMSYPEGTRMMILTAVIPIEGRTMAEKLRGLQLEGFSRVEIKGEVIKIGDLLKKSLSEDLGVVNLVIDRLLVENSKETVSRLTDSVETAFSEGNGSCIVKFQTLSSSPTTEKSPFSLSLGRIYPDTSGEYPKSLSRLSGRERGREDLSRHTGRVAEELVPPQREGERSIYPASAGEDEVYFSRRFEADGIVFESPNVHMFSFNSPVGACPTCEGFGRVIGIDEDLVIPNKSLSIYEDAIACWKGEVMGEWKMQLIHSAEKFKFPVHKPYYELTDAQRELLWTGNNYFEGLNAFFKHLEANQYKIQYRVMLARYRGKTLCPECRGSRLKKEALYVHVAGKNICDLVLTPISRLKVFFENISLDEHDASVAKRLLLEINNRIQFLQDVGLGYLTLNRLSNSLSGGESQRINLATSLGSSLVGSLYILDEPSIGLHDRDTHLLIKVLKQLRDLGNTVVVVEHDEEIIRAADYIIDIGPEAGRKGGEVVYAGNPKLPNWLTPNVVSLTGDFLISENNKLKCLTADPLLYDRLKELAKNHRQNPTPAEDSLWLLLSAKKLYGYKFRRQHIIGDFIVDFVCIEEKLIVELDGKYHENSEIAEYDRLRTEWLKSNGYQVIRFTNDDVFNKTDDVLAKVLETLHTQKSPMGDLGGYTLKYLLGLETIPVPTFRRKWNNYIEVIGVRENNLKNINVKFPLNVMTVVTGVSGSGKSSLVRNVFYSALKKHYGGISDRTGQFGALKGSMNLAKDIEFVDQNPIGRSSRSNPVTYIKAYDEIRKLFAEQQLSKQMGYTASHFSFNTDGGRCEECQGEGTVTVEMQFMADLVLECEHCHGKRFKQDILDVKYKDATIYDVLEMTVNQAIEFFETQKGSVEKKIVKRLKPLQDVGVGYVKLGQSSSTLSGGESQRVKLASFLANEKPEPTIFVFDEPTTGLHFHDIKTLLNALEALIVKGHTVIIIEHNPEVIKCADHIIDIGPEGGEEGGNIVFEGRPEDLVKCKQSYTGQFLKKKLENVSKVHE